MTKELTNQEREHALDLLNRARKAMALIENYSQQELDRLAQAIGWFSSNEKTFTKLAQMGVDESGIGDRLGRPAKRFKINGALRDALRHPST